MKYIIKKIIIGVAIGAILMFIGNMVPKADSYHKENISNPVCNRGNNCSSFTTAIDYVIPPASSETNDNLEINITPIDLTSYNGFKVTTYISMYDSTYFTDQTESPLEWQCTDIGQASGRITYADGTTAIISNLSYCSEFNVTNVSSSYFSVGTNLTDGFLYQMGYRYNSSNSYQQCFIESSSNNSITWNCPKTSNGGIETVSQLKFNIKHRNDNNTYFYLNASAGIQAYVSADNRIITNMNNVANILVDSMTSNTTNIISTINSLISAVNSGNQATQQAINQNTQATQQQTQTITNSDVSGANSDADALKNNTAFDDNTGISSLITLPLRFVNNLGTACSPINLTIPYMETQVQIPCFRQVITSKMPALATLVTLVVNGFILYNIFIQIIDMIHGAKNPEDDRLEVVEL